MHIQLQPNEIKTVLRTLLYQYDIKMGPFIIKFISELQVWGCLIILQLHVLSFAAETDFTGFY